MDLLKQYRQQIDEIDTELLALLEKRLLVAQEVGKYKQAHGMEVYVPEREQQVIADRLQRCKEASFAPQVRQFFKNLMEISRQVQLPPQKIEAINRMNCQRVVYQGMMGGYAHEAALQYFEGEMKGVKRFEDVFKAITSGDACYGMLPLENSQTGGINDVYDLLGQYNLYIVGEHILPIQHCLLGLPRATMEDIQTVYSHAQALMQCSAFIDRKGLRPREESNTATAAQHIIELGDQTCAAIASAKAGAIYGLPILKTNIADADNNRTRFVAVGTQLRKDAACNKISITFTVRHEPGTLLKALEPIYDEGLDMMLIESRAIPHTSWEYRFFVDFLGNIQAQEAQRALEKIQKACTSLKVIGAYPKGNSV